MVVSFLPSPGDACRLWLGQLERMQYNMQYDSRAKLEETVALLSMMDTVEWGQDSFEHADHHTSYIIHHTL